MVASVENLTHADDARSCLVKRTPAPTTRQNHLFKNYSHKRQRLLCIIKFVLVARG